MNGGNNFMDKHCNRGLYSLNTPQGERYKHRVVVTGKGTTVLLTDK